RPGRAAIACESAQFDVIGFETAAARDQGNGVAEGDVIAAIMDRAKARAAREVGGEDGAHDLECTAATGQASAMAGAFGSISGCKACAGHAVCAASGIAIRKSAAHNKGVS